MTRTSTTPLMILAAAAAFGAATLPTSTAEAGRVVVLAVQGDPEGELEDGLISIIEDRHDLVTSGEFDRAARKSGVDDLDGPAIGKLARKLGADAVIESSVSREDEGFLLVVRIRGANGKTVKKISVDLSKPRLSSKAKKRLGPGVLDGVDKVLGLAGEERVDDDDDEADDEARQPTKKEQARAAKAARAKAAKDKKAKARGKKAARELVEDEPEMADEGEAEADEGSDDEGSDDEGSDDGEDADDGDGDGGGDDDRVAARDDDSDVEEALGVRKDDGERGGRAHDLRRPAVRIELGPSAIARTLSFTTRPDFAEKPLGYKTTLVPGARIAGEVYPLGFKDPSSIAAGLGVAFEYDQTLLAKARTSDAPEIPLPVTQRHWEVGARFRYAFGDRPTLPSVTLGVGYGHRFYGVDRGELPAAAKLDIPDVAYKMIIPHLAVRVPIGTRIAVNGAGRALLISSSGSVQNVDSYGGAKITGFEVNGGLEVRITGSVTASLAGSMTQIGYDFVGNGAETNGRDLDPDTQDIGGMADRYLGVVATVGYMY